MKKFLKVLAVIVGIVLLALVLFSAYIAVNGRSILIGHIEKSLGLKVQVSGLKIQLPHTIVAEGVELSDTLTINRLEVSPSLLGFLSGHVVLNYLLIDRLQVTISRMPDDEFDFGIDLTKIPRGGKPAVVYINKLLLRNGEITLIDKGLAGQGPFVVKLADLDLDIFRPSLAQILRMQFSGQGTLTGETAVPIGAINLNGWVEPLGRNLNAIVRIQDGSFIYFEPYYKKYLKKELASGNVSMTIDAKAKNNDLVADCSIALTKVAFKKEEPSAEGAFEQKKDFSDFAFMTFDSLLSADGGMTFDFTIRTKLDKPKFENVKFRGDFFKNRIEATFSKSPQETIEDFKKIGKDFEAIGKQFKEIFKK